MDVNSEKPYETLKRAAFFFLACHCIYIWIRCMPFFPLIQLPTAKHNKHTHNGQYTPEMIWNCEYMYAWIRNDIALSRHFLSTSVVTKQPAFIRFYFRIKYILHTIIYNEQQAVFEWWQNKTLHVIRYISSYIISPTVKFSFRRRILSNLLNHNCMSMSIHEYKLSAICRLHIKRIVPYIGHINVCMILKCELSRERDFMIAQAKLSKMNGVALKIAKCDYDLQSLITITHTHTHTHPYSLHTVNSVGTLDALGTVQISNGGF